MAEDPLPGEALRDAFLAAKGLQAEARRRLLPYVTKTISQKLIEEHEAEGWVLDRRNKASVRMRKPKTHDRAFEDRVWATFAKLHFTWMNRDQYLRIQYGKQSNESKQIDVFAADGEVVLIVECKSSAAPRSYQFKGEVEAIQSTRAGIVKAVRKEFPDHKIKFMLATNNFNLSRETTERIEQAEIVHFDEDAIDYYLDLAAHLGRAARFQLLGALFAGAKIPGLDSTVAAIEGSMGGHHYYSFAIEPERLLKMGYILHRNKAQSSLMPTYQRLIKKSRLKRVAQFVEGGGFFPNSIIVNIDPPGRQAKLRFESVGKIQGEAKLGILHLPQTYRAAFIIDGQHRLYGYADSTRASSDLVPVVAFVRLQRSEQVRIFMEINENQQAVPKNLRNTLNADLLWGSTDLREQSRAMKLRIAQHLGEDRRSPLQGRIIIGENKRTLMRCITIDAVSRGLDRGRFLGTYTKSEAKEHGTFDFGSHEATFDFTTAFLELFFLHVRDSLESQWTLGSAEGGFVFINNGIEALLRVISDVVDHVTAEKALDLLKCDPQDVFDACIHYVGPLLDYLAGLDVAEAAEYKGQYGSGAATRYWRRFQEAIRHERPAFNPLGLDDYLDNEARAFNAESGQMVQELEAFLKKDIQARLEEEFDSRWYKSGVPRKVRQAAEILALERNLDVDEDDEVDPWECLYLIDYQAILQQSRDLWLRRFEKRYTRPGEENKAGGWKSKTAWLLRLNDVRNDAYHNRPVSAEDHEFLVELKTWLILEQADNEL